MTRFAWIPLLVFLVCPSILWAQAAEPAEPVPADSVDEYESLSARKAVHQGNQHLADGDVDAALQAYRHARTKRPDAPQIPFGQGLAELQRKDYAAARERFRETAAGGNADLAADAQYALGASHHMEALESENPEAAIEHLEAAMERYRDVLSRMPDHSLARESDYKAASMRRRLKQLLQQQQQQQQQQNDDGEQDDQDKQQSDGQEQQEGEQNKEEKPSESPQQEGEQEQSQQQSGDEQQEQQDQQQQQSQEDETRESEQQEQASERQEEISREQAERRLREMMQAIRDRQKERRQSAKKVPLPPVGKDW